MVPDFFSVPVLYPFIVRMIRMTLQLSIATPTERHTDTLTHTAKLEPIQIQNVNEFMDVKVEHFICIINEWPLFSTAHMST